MDRGVTEEERDGRGANKMGMEGWMRGKKRWRREKRKEDVIQG